MTQKKSHGARLRAVLAEHDITPFIGIYDVFSSSVASRHFDGLFVSGFGFATSHVTRLLEDTGASGVIIEDQLRPRKCGHFDGKQIMPLEQFLPKL
jgi:2-methylisocitrate lyase-like PEP mutase family enzyme